MSTKINLRLDAATLAMLDEFAKDVEANRSHAIRRLIRAEYERRAQTGGEGS